MRHLFFILVCCCSSCATYVYQPEITGVVCDFTTKQPVADADIVFIQDTLTLGATYGSLNFNAGKRYTTDENGSFQTEVWKDRFMNNHHFRSDLSWMFVVEKPGYVPDTMNLRDMGTLNKPKHLLDTIWLRQMPEASQSILPTDDQYQEQEKREIASFVETLKANGVAVNDSVFRHRIMQLLNIDVRPSDQSDEGYQDMTIRGQLMEYVLCPQGNFIKSGMELLPNEQISLQNMLEESRNPGSYIYNVIALNKILFMNEAYSAIYIVSDEYLRDLASDIVVLFCYESNRKLIEYVITQQDEHLRYADSYVTNLLFDNANQIRVDFLSEINRQRPELIEKLISIMLDERDRIISVSEDRIDEALAFLFDMRD